MKRIVICLVFVLLFVGAANAQTKTMTGNVISTEQGMYKWEGIVIKVGTKKYLVYTSSGSYPTPKTVGTIDEVGRTVQVFYTKIVKGEYDGEVIATKIVELRGLTSLQIPSHIRPQHRSVLQAWLATKQGWRPATLTDAFNGANRDAREFLNGGIRAQGNNYHPYYAVADFNQDGIQDFAVIIIDQRGNRAIGIFNGPFGPRRNGIPTFYSGNIGQGDWIFWRTNDQFGNRFIIGPLDSDGGFVIRPRGRAYVVQ